MCQRGGQDEAGGARIGFRGGQIAVNIEVTSTGTPEHI
jgi:hypothetical protein